MLKKGFTLAEVLLTLTIIGVVAAIIMPALMTNVNDNVLEAQVKKFYSQLTAGLEMYKANHEQDTLVAGLDLNDFCDRVLNTSSCNSVTDCFAATYKKMDGTVYGTAANILPDINAANARFRRLRDGSVFSIIYTGEEDIPWGVTVDVNGERGPNTLGLDTFHMGINTEGKIIISNVDAADCQNEDESGSCIGILAANNFRFRNYRAALANPASSGSGNGDGGNNGNNGNNGNGGGNSGGPLPFNPINGGNTRPINPTRNP